MFSSNQHRRVMTTVADIPAPGSEGVGITPSGNIRRESHETRHGLSLRKPIKGILRSPKAYSEPQRLGAGELLTRRQRRNVVSFSSTTSDRWESQASNQSAFNSRPRRRRSGDGTSRVNHVWESVTPCALEHSSASFSSNARPPCRRTISNENLKTRSTNRANIFKASAASFLLDAGAMSSPVITTQTSISGCAA